MLAVGNGTPQQCVFNLLSIVRGENPYERCKGMSAELSDQPLTKVMGEIVTEAIWNVKNYEPRADAEDINLVMDDVLKGRYLVGTMVSTGNG